MGVLPAAGSPGLHLQRALGGTGSGNATDNAYSPSSFFLDNLAFAIPLGVGLSTLSLLTFLGNAMVVHAIRTERKLHTVRFCIIKFLFSKSNFKNLKKLNFYFAKKNLSQTTGL